MLGRIVNVIFGGLFFASGGYMLFLHLTSGEPLRGFILLMGGGLLVAGAACIRIGLRRHR